MQIVKITLLTMSITLATACVNAQEQQAPQGGPGGEPPSVDQIFSEMDANQDGKLAQAEVKGPLANDFAKIDSNGDGFISKDELENAPKPQGGQDQPPPPQN